MYIKNTRDLIVGDTLVLFQEDRRYYYEVIKILDFNNVDLKLKGTEKVYYDVRLNEDGNFKKG